MKLMSDDKTDNGGPGSGPSTSRAERSGRATGLAIVEMVSLMYQKNTARNFWKGFCDAATQEQHERDRQSGKGKR